MTRWTSDLDLLGNEIKNGRFEVLAYFPAHPFLGQLFLYNNGPFGILYYWNGQSWVRTDGGDILGQVVTSVNDRKGPVVLDKTDVGLGNANNTADIDKPVSYAQAQALGQKVDLTAYTAHVLSSSAHGVSGSVVGTAGTQTLTQKTLISPVITSPTGIVKGDVGLGNVQNLAPADMPVSTATQTAIDTSSLADRDRLNHTGLQTASTISDFHTAVRTNRLDQMAIPIFALNMNGLRIVNGADPLNATDFATKEYVDTFSAGVDFHQSVLVASAGNINVATPPTTIDSITMNVGDRVLLKDQNNPVENGIYTYATPMVRANDANNTGELMVGSTVFIKLGASNGGEQWVVASTSANPWVPGSSTSGWVQNSATPSLGTTVVAATSYGLASSAGAAGTVSRSDHTHGSPPLTNNVPTIQAIGDSAATGTGIAPARDDHRHAMPSFGAVNPNAAFGASSSSGTAVTVARSDHNHGLPALDLDLVQIGDLAPSNDDIIQRKSGVWTNRSIAQLKGDLNLVADTASALTAEATQRAADVTAEATARSTADTNEANTRIAQDNLRVLKAGDTMTGQLNMSSWTVGASMGIRTFSITFPAGVANQKADLYFTATTPLNGMFDVTMVMSTGGLVEKRYAVAVSGSTLTTTQQRYSEVLGGSGTHAALSDLAWDATNSRWRIQVARRDTVALTLSIVVRVWAQPSSITANLATFGLGSIYTTDTTLLDEPVVWFDRLFIAQGSISSFNVPPAASYTITTSDSIILAQSGANVYLPSAVTAGVGRYFIVKNIGTSGVTVYSNGGTIDAATSMAVGNRSFATFMSDGQNWWRVS